MGNSAPSLVSALLFFSVLGVFMEESSDACHLGSFHAARALRIDREQNGANGKPGINIMNANMAERIHNALKEKKS